MRNKIIIIIIFIAILAVFVLSLNKKETLVSPTMTPAPTAFYNPPQEIKYDGSTDLKKELDTVNPEIFDSDFD